MSSPTPEYHKEEEEASWIRSLREMAFLSLIMAMFIERNYWVFIVFSYFLFRILNSDLGRRCIATLPRDLKGIFLLITVKTKIKLAFYRNQPIHYYFMEHVRRHPLKECTIEVDTGRTFNFYQLNLRANSYANYFQKLGYKKDDVIAMYMENGADFLAVWLGLSKIGVISAWINSNLKLEPLLHSLKVSNCRSIIVSPNLLTNLEQAINMDHFDQSIPVFLVDGNSESRPVLAKLISNNDEPIIPADLNFQSNLCYIYTSGTTGNPKPAVIKHYRYFWIAMGGSQAFGLRPNDRMYITLPMYHSAGGILGIGQVVYLGCTMVIRKKFSASNFWKESIKYNCTASQYIGEICRYLLAQKPSPEDKKHPIRVMYGNGLRGEIWGEFVNRFNIKWIGELYGSSEGNSNIVNIDSKLGACGFFPIYPFLAPLYPVRLIKVNPDTGEPIRKADGLCVSCRPGDTGEMVGLIKKSDPLLRFEGYVNSTDTQKKLIRNVANHGDVFFSSGDILYWDRYGYLYFKDRRGDTYRWRGENVSTMEVEGILQPIMNIQDATVFGVEIPGREGRAGMIGVDLAEKTDIKKFLKEVSDRLCNNLATYAIPVFLRICKEVDKTGTFKLKKTTLQKENFRLENCRGDQLYYWDGNERIYKPMDKQMQENIITGIYNKI